jgi:hypothetical protein
VVAKVDEDVQEESVSVSELSLSLEEDEELELEELDFLASILVTPTLCPCFLCLWCFFFLHGSHELEVVVWHGLHVDEELEVSHEVLELEQEVVV